jgi:hypothetical protein
MRWTARLTRLLLFGEYIGGASLNPRADPLAPTPERLGYFIFAIGGEAQLG